MAEEAKKKPDAAPAGDKGGEKDGHGAKKAGGIAALLGKTPVMLGGIMLLEAVVLFAGFKFIGGGAPRSAAGAELVAVEGEHGAAAGDGHGGGTGAAIDKRKAAEVQVLDIKAPNKLSGRTFLYDVSIFVSTRAEHQEAVQATIKEREALIKDRVRTIIAQSDPEKLGGGSEPGLETLRRQVKYQLDEIVGEGLIDEVLVPRCIPYRTDY
ncbi:MAG TPA: hypothetical protein VGN72_13940 [Tepidisphaeraceae bacterium]|jgi:hypothetical protein|nr:hypothetical protein [Tepidisphaeraceae bacterium]